MANGLVDRYCEGCVHLCNIANGWMKHCNYIFNTGKRRPCPPGYGCRVKATRRGRRKKGAKL